jgi:predicted metalloprotease with PDZ domain
MIRKLVTRLALLVALFSAFVVVDHLDSLVSLDQDIRLDYTIEAVPDEPFQVELRVGGLRGTPEFRILDGWGMLQDQADHIEQVTARDEEGTVLPVVRKSNEGETIWRLESRPRGEILITYRVRPYDPNESPEASFVDTRRLVMLGYSVFLQPTAVRNYEELPITVVLRGPEGWNTWASWPRVGRTFCPATSHDLWSGVAASGDFHSSRMESDGVSVTVLTEYRIQEVVGTTIANRLFPVMQGMHDLFGAPPRGDSLRVLAIYRVRPFEDNMSIMTGNSEEGAFLCLASPDHYVSADALSVLATHECLHFYLGGAIAASPEPPFRNAPDLVWLVEGITEYLTFRVMERAGILSSEDVSAVVRRKEKEYLSHPGWRTTTLADAARRMGDLETYGLVYSKGFLVGKLLDEEMTRRCGEGTFENALRELFRERNFYLTGNAVTRGVARDVFESHCPETALIIDRYAHGTLRLPSLFHDSSDDPRVAATQ